MIEHFHSRRPRQLKVKLPGRRCEARGRASVKGVARRQPWRSSLRPHLDLTSTFTSRLIFTYIYVPTLSTETFYLRRYVTLIQSLQCHYSRAQIQEWHVRANLSPCDASENCQCTSLTSLQVAASAVKSRRLAGPPPLKRRASPPCVYPFGLNLVMDRCNGS